MEKVKITDIDRKTMLVFFAFVIGMFMAILDIQIVASSLSVIAAGLSASSDELSWIQTSYLIAEVIIIPITGFSSRLLSTRISYFIAAFGFTIMSLLCSLAWNIESMIFFRALQGLFGGAMIPTAFAAILIIFPRSLHSTANIIMGLVVTVAPTVGPTVGGYITEVASWQLMFLINVIPGIFVCYVVYNYVDLDKPNYNLLNNFDYIGVAMLVIGLGSLQYILEEAPKKDWFNDTHILILSIISAFSFIVLIVHELSHKNPIINLYAFKNKNFTFGCVFSFILGVGLYGTVYLLPLYFFTIVGYDTYQIGVTMIITGMFQFISAPIAGRMFDSGVDKRIILGIGFGLMGLGCYLNSFLTPESEYWEWFVPQMVRGFALMFCFMPINDLTLGTIPKNQLQDASGLYNLTRNLGGAIGLAVINSMILSYTTINFDEIANNISSNHFLIDDFISNISGYLSSYSNDTEIIAQQIIGENVRKNAFIIAINNIFVNITILFWFGMALIPLTKPTKEL